MLHWPNGVDDFPLGEPVVHLFEGCPAKMRILYQLPQHVFYIFFDPTVSSQVDLSIFYVHIQVRVAGGSASARKPRRSSPQPHPLASPVDSQIIPRPAERYNLSSVSWGLFPDRHVITPPARCLGSILTTSAGFF